MLILLRYLPQDRNGNMAANTHQYINVKVLEKMKTWHGWNNPITARLLCPVDYIDQFDANPDEYVIAPNSQDLQLIILHPSTMEKLMDGLLTLNDTAGNPKLPAFLYDEDMRDGSLTMGLFRGPLLLAVCMAIPGVWAPGLSLPLRCILQSSYCLPVQLVKRHHQSRGTLKYTVWGALSPQQSVTQQYMFIPIPVSQTHI